MTTMSLIVLNLFYQIITNKLGQMAGDFAGGVEGWAA